jgi:hypothetical protein
MPTGYIARQAIYPAARQATEGVKHGPVPRGDALSGAGTR